MMLVASAATGHAEEREHLQFFEANIRPLLAGNCFKCHGEGKQKGGLRLDSIERINRGGESGAAVEPGDVEGSLLIRAIRRTDEDLAMPPKHPLPASDIALLEQWVKMGAPWPVESAPDKAVALDENGFTADDYNWWAVQPVTDPAVPAPISEFPAEWSDHPIDRFVARRLHDVGLDPAPPASPSELVRRIYFDLHGLPPTPEQIEAFVADSAVDANGAVETLIDELLASPRYGERWGQHWLDIARFAESDGYRADFFRSEAWRYREYVIRAFNEDKPYDQFVLEQLAADEFASDEPETLVATGFLRHGIYEYNQRNAKMHWELILNEMTNVTGEVFLGVGIGCAQCHNHKFDPILQKDYYSLQAFLSSTWWPEHRPLGTTEQIANYENAFAEWERETASIREEMEGMVAELRNNRKEYAVNQFPEDVQQMYRKETEARTPYEEQLTQLVQRQVEYEYGNFDPLKALGKQPESLARYKELEQQLKAYESSKPKELPMAFIATDVGTEAAPAVLKSRQGKQLVEPAFLTLLGQAAPKITPTETTTGRRHALGRWITDPENPLSTRVIVNRVWQHHFGRGIVATPNDFGRLGEPPSHPELFDWLTSRFIEKGWKLKALHRVIMTSSAYRQTARQEPMITAKLQDPANLLLWRFPARRLSAEQVRDAMLAVSGELTDGSGQPSKDGQQPVRSVYVKKIRNTPDPVLFAFDAPSGFESAPNRLQTTTPNQSLLLVNNDWPLRRAKAFATRLLHGADAVSVEMITEAFQLAYGRNPQPEESEMALEFVHAQMSDPPQVGAAPDVLAALTEFCHALLGSNEFLYLH
ncbi:MAG: DUF1553 domain-containing protein [Verrucomicrobiales bacterium]